MTTIHDILNFRPQRFQGGQQSAWQPFGGLQPFGGQPSQPMPGPPGPHGHMLDVFHGMFPPIGMAGQGGMQGLGSIFGGVNQAGMGGQGSPQGQTQGFLGTPTQQFGNTPWKLPDISGFLQNFQQRQPSPYTG